MGRPAYTSIIQIAMGSAYKIALHAPMVNAKAAIRYQNQTGKPVILIPSLASNAYSSIIQTAKEHAYKTVIMAATQQQKAAMQPVQQAQMLC